jgi:Ubiquitin family
MDLAQTLLEDSEGDRDGTYGQIGKSTCSRSFPCSINLFLRCLNSTWQDHPPKHEILKHHLKSQMHDRGQGRRPTDRQRVRFEGIPLEDAQALENYNI